MEKDATPVGDKMDKPVQDPMEYIRQQSKLLSPVVFEESDEEVVGLSVNVSEVILVFLATFQRY